MTHLNTIANINLSIENVINKGAQILYDRYLNTKLPQHTNIDINNTIITNINTNVLEHDSKSKFKPQKQPKTYQYDTLQVGKLRYKPKSQLQSYQNIYKLGIKEQKDKKNSFIYSNNHKNHIKPNVCIKYECQKTHEFTQRQNELRKDKIQKGKIRKIIQDQLQKKKQLFIAKKKKLEQQVQDLAIKGISYTFDYNQEKIIQFNCQPTPQKKLLALKYQTIDLPRFKSKQVHIQNLTGRKIGFYTNRLKKKQKISESDYNNNGQRQVSAIPFMTIESGVKVVQPMLNVIAHRRRSNQPTKNQYNDHVRNKMFRSFMPNTSQRFGSIDQQNNQEQQRPTTTNFTSGKNTAQTGMTRRSILWRPQTTSSKNHKIKVNKELIQQMVNKI